MAATGGRRSFGLMRLMSADSVATVAVPAGRLLTSGRTIDAVGHLVQTARIAQKVVGAVTAPKRRSNHSTISAFSAF